MIFHIDISTESAAPPVVDAHGHRRKSIEQPCLSTDWPPGVEKDFEWSPHGHPSSDHEAFTGQAAEPRSGPAPRDQRADHKERPKKNQANHETDSPSSEHAAQSAEAVQRPILEELVHRISQQLGIARRPRRSVHMDEQPEWRVPRDFSGPAYDELFDVTVEIPIQEGGRIDGIEQLMQLGDADFDRDIVRRDDIAACVDMR